MNTSESINEIAAALAKAQAKIRNPAKNKVNPHFKSKYADLADGLDVIRPALSEQGIAFIQRTEVVDDGVILRTRLIHSSGQWIESTYPVSKMTQHQQMGAALTYAKRQSLFALVGVCGDDDLDGEDIKDVPTGVGRPVAGKVRSIAPISAEQAEALKSMIVETGADLPKFLAYFGLDHIEDMRASDFERAVTSLNRKKAANE